MDDFIVEWDYKMSLLITGVIIIYLLVGYAWARLKKKKRTKRIFLGLIVGSLVCWGGYSLIAAEVYLKKQALKELDPAWMQAVENKLISDVPVRAILVVDDYLIIRMLSDEMYYVPYEKIGVYKRKVTPQFIKSKKAFINRYRTGGISPQPY